MNPFALPQSPARASARLAFGLTGRRAFALASPAGSNQRQTASGAEVCHD